MYKNDTAWIDVLTILKYQVGKRSIYLPVSLNLELIWDPQHNRLRNHSAAPSG